MANTASTKRRTNQKPKGPVDPTIGMRVRQVRLARGLTQRQLAGSDFTPGFVSLLEGGQTRASVRALGILAARLDLAVSELMAPQAGRADQTAELELFAAERSLAAGDAERARRTAEAVLGRASGLMRSRAQRVIGRAFLALRKPREAITILDEARRTLRSSDQPELLARVTLDLAYAHAALSEFAEAAGLALECERLIEARTVVDRTFELRVMNFLATMFVDLGEVGAADVRAERAMLIARDMSDLNVTALLYAGLAITRQKQGDLEAALVAARKSLSTYEELGREREVAEAWNTLAWLSVERKQFARAEEALKTATKLAREVQHEQLLALIAVSAAELALARGRPSDAVTLADGVMKNPAASDYARAEALFVRARALASDHATGAVVRRAFEQAFRAFAAQPPRSRAKVHEAYAADLASRNQHRDAYEQSRAALACKEPGAI